MSVFTACGGDDEDLPGEDTPGTATYYEPCFDWGSNVDHVKAYMAGWQLMEGSIPNKQRQLVVAWAILHRDELEANWELGQNKQAMYKIEPLR